MGSRSLLQGFFPTQGSNPGLLHCRWTLYHLSHQGSCTGNLTVSRESKKHFILPSGDHLHLPNRYIYALQEWWRRKWQPTPVLLPGKFHGLRGSSEPSRLQSMGSQRVGHNWVTSDNYQYCDDVLLCLAMCGFKNKVAWKKALTFIEFIIYTGPFLSIWHIWTQLSLTIL